MIGNGATLLNWVGLGWEYQSPRTNQISTKPCQLGIFTYTTCILTNFYLYSCQSAINFYVMSWHTKSKIESREELEQEIRTVIQCLHGIPSMSDKLPNYIYNRIESIIEYVKEKGWS